MLWICSWTSLAIVWKCTHFQMYLLVTPRNGHIWKCIRLSSTFPILFRMKIQYLVDNVALFIEIFVIYFSIKFVGLFVIVLVGISTAGELWRILGDLTLTMVTCLYSFIYWWISKKSVVMFFAKRFTKYFFVNMNGIYCYFQSFYFYLEI